MGKIRMDKEGRISISTDYLKELNKKGNVKIIETDIDTPEKAIMAGVAFKVIPVATSERVKLDKFFMKIFNLKIGDKVSIKGMRNSDLEFITTIEGILNTKEDGSIGLDEERRKLLDIYDEGHCLLRKLS